MGVWACFPRHRLQRKSLVSDRGMHHGTCVTHVPWCMSGSLTRSGGENVPSIPGARATRNCSYLVRGPWRARSGLCPYGTHTAVCVSLFKFLHKIETLIEGNFGWHGIPYKCTCGQGTRKWIRWLDLPKHLCSLFINGGMRSCCQWTYHVMYTYFYNKVYFLQLAVAK